MFLDRNLDTSQLTVPRDPAPPLLRRLRPGSTSAQVCSGLLTHLTRNRQLLTRSPKGPPFPARGPKSVPTVANSQTVILVCLSSCVGPFSALRMFYVVLCVLPRATYSINDQFPLVFTSILTHLLTHLLTYLLTVLPIFSHIFHPSSHTRSHTSPHPYSLPLLSSLQSLSHFSRKTFFSRLRSRYPHPHMHSSASHEH
jgi:hypothetical protein